MFFAPDHIVKFLQLLERAVVALEKIAARK
jgi:hypothetical protein